jgi:hypothetical protein
MTQVVAPPGGATPGGRPFDEDHYTNVLEPRGISRSVAFGRPYFSFDKGEKNRVRRLGWNGDLGCVQQSGGLLIARHRKADAYYERELGFVPLPRLDPYLRFDSDVFIGEFVRYMNPTGASAIDVHPHVKPLLKSRRPQAVFLVLEGCLKADAITSTGQGLACVSVPGVTMWGKAMRESRDFDHDWGPTLKRARAVFVLTDSDWRSNAAVARQAQACVAFLRSRGFNPIHISPPQNPTDPKMGVDDFLASGGDILGLVAVPRPAVLDASTLRKEAQDVYQAALGMGRVVGTYAELRLGKKRIQRGMRALEEAEMAWRLPQSRSYIGRDRAGVAMFKAHPMIWRLAEGPSVPIGEAWDLRGLLGYTRSALWPSDWAEQLSTT